MAQTALAETATPSHLHPVALRSECNASSVASKAAHDASVQLRESTNQKSAPKVKVAFSGRRPHMPSNNNTVFGLKHTEEYAAHPHNPQIKLLSAHQYAALAAQELAFDTPEQALFPWLHGADQTGTHQAYYFGCTPHNPCQPPRSVHCSSGFQTIVDVGFTRFRGLTTVSCDPELPQNPHARAASLNSSFESSTSISSYSSASSSDGSYADDSSDFFNVNALPFGPEPRPSQLLSSFTPDELLHPSADPPAFNVPKLQPNQINLRNFKLQASKIASLSDIVIYAAEGLASSDLLPTAERFLDAQTHTRQQRAAQCGVDESDMIQYNVFVVSDRFETFERRLPHLVAVSSNGFRRHKTDFFEQEKHEMQRLTQASPIADGVWLGNTGDVPLPQESPTPQGHQTPADTDLQVTNSQSLQPAAQRSRLASSDSSSSLEQDTIEDGNPHKFNICIEAHDQAIMPSIDDFKQIDAYFSRIEPQKIEPNQIVHVECSSSSQTCVYAADMDQLFVTFTLTLYLPC